MLIINLSRYLIKKKLLFLMKSRNISVVQNIHTCIFSLKKRSTVKLEEKGTQPPPNRCLFVCVSVFSKILSW